MHVSIPCRTCVHVILTLCLQHSADSSQWLMPGILIEPKAHVKAGDFDRIVVLQVGLLMSNTAGCWEHMSRAAAPGGIRDSACHCTVAVPLQYLSNEGAA